MWVSEFGIIWWNFSQYLLCNLSEVPCTAGILGKNSCSPSNCAKQYWHPVMFKRKMLHLFKMTKLSFMFLKFQIPECLPTALPYCSIVEWTSQISEWLGFLFKIMYWNRCSMSICLKHEAMFGRNVSTTIQLTTTH